MSGDEHCTKERRREYMREWRKAHPDYQKKWSAENPGKRNQYQQQSRADNPERTREYSRKWLAANREKAQASVRRWQSGNPEKVRACLERWNLANPEYQKDWHAANPEKARAKKQRRRASVKTSTANAPTAKQLKALLALPCYYCGDPSAHIDHYIPLARGGTHTLDNLRAACAPCNFSKGAKLPSEWKGRKK